MTTRLTGTMVKPSRSVLKAFGVSDPVLMRDGTELKTYKAGNLILKPAENQEEILWIADVFAKIKQEGFRVPRYLKSKNGKLIVEGWYAQEFMAGSHSKNRWKETIEACKAFHRSLIGIKMPKFIGRADSPFSRADRIAWGEEKAVYYPELKKPMDELLSVIKPVKLPSQAIHGDFTMNVLFSKRNPPTVIDFTPYWRPAEFATAIVVEDALVWYGADQSILDYVIDVEDLDQMLVRAAIRRIMIIDGFYRLSGKNNLNEIEEHLKTVELICSRIREGV